MKEYTKIVLIPAYKPGPIVVDTAARMQDMGFTVVIVDDGSGSRCAPVFQLAEQVAIVITHPGNRGKGAALRTGLSYIRDRFRAPYIVVTADADGQHKPEDIFRTAQSAMLHPGSLVLGSRRFDKDVPLRSRFGNTVTRWVFRLASGTSVYDTQTGLRAFTDELTERMLEISGDRYEYEMNVLMELAKEGTDIREETIETVYIDDNSSSHFDTVKDSVRIYREILRRSAGLKRGAYQ